MTSLRTGIAFFPLPRSGISAEQPYAHSWIVSAEVCVVRGEVDGQALE